MPDETDLLTTKQAAAIHGVSDARIRQLILKGVLPAIKIGDERRGQWIIKRPDLAKLKPRRRR